MKNEHQDGSAIDVAAMTGGDSAPASPRATGGGGGSSTGGNPVATTITEGKEEEEEEEEADGPSHLPRAQQLSDHFQQQQQQQQPSSSSLGAVRAAMVEGLYEAMRERLACQAEEVSSQSHKREEDEEERPHSYFCYAWAHVSPLSFYMPRIDRFTVDRPAGVPAGPLPAPEPGDAAADGGCVGTDRVTQCVVVIDHDKCV
jgi:hypothetical protein